MGIKSHIMSQWGLLDSLGCILISQNTCVGTLKQKIRTQNFNLADRGIPNIKLIIITVLLTLDAIYEFWELGIFCLAVFPKTYTVLPLKDDHARPHFTCY